MSRAEAIEKAAQDLMDWLYCGQHPNTSGRAAVLVDALRLPPDPEPEPVDPSTLRVGDRVRKVYSTGNLVEFTVNAVRSSCIESLDGPYLSTDGTWYLLDRPAPPEPGPEVVAAKAGPELWSRRPDGTFGGMQRSAAYLQEQYPDLVWLVAEDTTKENQK